MVDSQIYEKFAKNNLIALCLASFVVTVGFGVIMPFFPLYAKEILSVHSFFGISVGIALQIGVLTSAFMFMRFMMAPAYGDLSDSSGRKPIILVGMTVYAFLLVGYGLAYDFISLLLMRALQGMASAAVWPVGEALIVDTSSKKQTGRNLGYYIMSMQAGMASGPFLGAIVYAFFGEILLLSPSLAYRLTFISQGVMGILATVIVALLVKDPKDLDKSELNVFDEFKVVAKLMIVKTIGSPKYLLKTFNQKTSYRTLSLYVIYTVAVINGFGNAMIFPIMTLFLSDFFFLDATVVALIVGIVGVLALSGNPLGGYLSDHFGRKPVTWISGLFRGIFYLLLGIEWGLLPVIALFVATRFTWSIFQPSFRAMQSDMIPEAVRGKEFGIVQALFNLGSIIGPVLGGAVYDTFFNVHFSLFGIGLFGVGATFAIAGIFSIIGSILLLIYTRPVELAIDKKIEVLKFQS